MYLTLAIGLQLLYVTCIVGLAIYGFHALWLTWHSLRKHRNNHHVPIQQGKWPDTTCVTAGTATDPDINALVYPHVTIQLPIYNEHHVVERLIRACAMLDYPKDKLQIQILDDSDDNTSVIVRQCVAKWSRRQRDIAVVNRPKREGYKAGALAHAMPATKGDFIAIFDADFVPTPDFLSNTVPHFLEKGNERIGFIQARWGHLNPDYSLLTRCQALALDGHFVVEQEGRQKAGFPFGFNGSAGIWRRACIQDVRVGGWQSDTLCEDLDLSYRAQLAGWHGLYLNDVEAPAEIPPQLMAFKRQQFRWAKGSIQTLRKQSRAVLQSPWNIATRGAALFHLGAYLIHPLLLGLLLITLPLMLLGLNPAAPLAYLSITSLGPPLLYAVAQRNLHPSSWLKRWLHLPFLMLLGTGMSLSNTVAVYQGLVGNEGEFLRTPKFHVRSRQDGWQGSTYRLRLQRIVIAETLLCVYALCTAVYAATIGKWWSIPFLLIYAGGYGLMVGIGLWQDWQTHRVTTTAKPTQADERPSLQYKPDHHARA